MTLPRDYERSPDILDEAGRLTQRLNEAAVEDASWKARPEQVKLPDGSWPQTECEDCGEDIEEGRLQRGYIRCISCQRVLEHRQKLGLR